MSANRSKLWTRRLLLQRAAQLGALGAAYPWAINLAAVGEAAAFDATDYKALVCVFLYGGNDYANTVVPYDISNYDLYSAIRGGSPGRTRGGIALGLDELAATALVPVGGQALTDGLQYALAPELAGLKSLFDAGKLAVQLNVGPLIVPLTLAQYESPNRVLYPLPPKLFSHNDQQSIWQSLGGEGSTVGWGGRLGDLALSSNGNAVLTCISAAGNAVFVSGRSALQYQISTDGAIKVSALQSSPYGMDSVRDALAALITQSSAQSLEEEYAVVTRRSIQLEGVVNGALAGVNPSTMFDASNPLATQMKIVARLIGARNALGAKDIREAQKGIVLASFLKLLMPVIIVLPGIAAVALAPNLPKPDQAYPHLMAMLPSGILGLVFAALIAAIVASLGSKINSIATIFTMDVYRPLRPQTSQQKLVLVGRLAAATALTIAIVSAKPLLGSFDQAFQYIQDYTGYVTPGICVIFLLGMFWDRCTAAGALVAAIGSAVLSAVLNWRWPTLPFMDRVGLVFLACLAVAAVISLAQPRPEAALRVDLKNIDYSTSTGFNVGAGIVAAILIAFYALWW